MFEISGACFLDKTNSNQVANEVRDPREAEWRGLLSEIGPILERAMRVVRLVENQVETCFFLQGICNPLFRCMHSAPGSIVEGPLTWRALTSKSQHKSHSPSHDDDISLPEPIPYINVAAEKDAIRAAPHVGFSIYSASIGDKYNFRNLI